MIVLICLIVMFVIGLILIIAPKTGVNPDKLKEGITYEEAVKRNRYYGIFILILSIFFFFCL